ncbi:MAG: hypothetical protein GY754_40190 [bacterium]|nr:hypothetical protein [bacterium]
MTLLRKYNLIFFICLFLFSGCTACIKDVRRGEAFMESKNYDNAVASFEQALYENPDNEKIKKMLENARKKATEFHLDMARSLFAGEKNIPKLEEALKEANLSLKHSTGCEPCSSIKEQIQKTTIDVQARINQLTALTEDHVKNRKWDDALLTVTQASTLNSNDKDIRALEFTIRESGIALHLEQADALEKKKKWKEVLHEADKAGFFAASPEQKNIVAEKTNFYKENAQSFYIARAEKYAKNRKWQLCFNELALGKKFLNNKTIKNQETRFKNWKLGLEVFRNALQLKYQKKYPAALLEFEKAHSLYPEHTRIARELFYSYIVNEKLKEKAGFLYTAVSFSEKARALQKSFGFKSRINIEKKISTLKGALKSYYEIILKTCTKNNLPGHVLLFWEHIDDLKIEKIESAVKKNKKYARLRLARSTKKDIAIFPFDNHSRSGGRDFSRMLANDLTRAVFPTNSNYHYCNFLGTDESSRIHNKYRYVKNHSPGDLNKNLRLTMGDADYLVIGTINKFSIEKDVPEVDSRSVRYVSGYHYETNPKWKDWKRCKRKENICYKNCQNKNKDYSKRISCGSLCSCGREPRKKLKRNNYSYHSYNIETHRISGTVRANFKIIEIKTGRTLFSNSKYYIVEDRDTYVQGFAAADIDHDPLELTSVAEVRAALSQGLARRIEDSLEKFIYNLPGKTFNDAEELESSDKKVHALEAYLEAWQMVPDNKEYREQYKKMKNSLKIKKLLNPDYTAILKKYKPLYGPAYKPVYSKNRKTKTAPAPETSGDDNKLFSSILTSVISRDYAKARAKIRVFIRTYPNSPLLKQVMDINDKIANK